MSSPPPPKRADGPRPPSPARSDVSFASSTTSFRRRTRDRHQSTERRSRPSRFDGDEIDIDDAKEYLSRPHSTWASASKELARLESVRERLDDDARSTTSSISAYSMASNVSVASRKGQLANLPKSPPPDLTIGGAGVGGFSFVAPRLGSSTSTVASQSMRSERVGGGAVMAGSASGKLGVRAMTTRATAKPTPESHHPSSAPGVARGEKPSSSATTGSAFTFQVSGQLVPRLAPKKSK